MESFLQRYRNLIALVVALAIQVVALATQIKRPVDPHYPQGGQVRLIRVWLVTAFTPFEKVFVNSGSSIRGAWSNYVYLRGVRQENRTLRAQIDQLRVERARLKENAEETHRLQSLLSFKERFIGQTVAAEVIGTSGVESSRVIYIDRGARDGMKVDMPVITPDGIVGRIKEVYAASSQVIEITDVTSGAGVILNSSRLRGILKGGTGSLPEITNIMADEKVEPGDEVLTSGGDSVFPPGLPVGTVERVSPDRDRDFFLSIQIKPAADLSRLEEVLVVTRIESTVPALKIEEAASGDERVADKLAEHLPTIDNSAQSTVSDEEPARPKPPLQPVHPDRFSTPTGNGSATLPDAGASESGTRKTRSARKAAGTQQTPAPDQGQPQPQPQTTGAGSDATTTPENTDTTKGTPPQ